MLSAVGFIPVDPKVVKSEEQRQLSSHLTAWRMLHVAPTQISLTHMLRVNLNTDLYGYMD
jgi:hypothetical protein